MDNILGSPWLMVFYIPLATFCTTVHQHLKKLIAYLSPSGYFINTIKLKIVENYKLTDLLVPKEDVLKVTEKYLVNIFYDFIEQSRGVAD